MRFYRHLVNAGVSVALDVEGESAKLSAVYLNRVSSDKFSRPAARQLLNLHFDANDSALKALGLTRNVYTFTYKGNMPCKDILKPLLREALASELETRTKSSWSGSVNTLNSKLKKFAKERSNKKVASKV